MDMAFERSDWSRPAAAQALIRNNGPLLAYLAGKRTRSLAKTTISGRRNGRETDRGD